MTISNLIIGNYQSALDNALDIAVEYKSTLLAQIFLYAGANPNRLNEDSTPLIKAIRGNDAPMVKVLLANHADIDYTFKTMYTPIAEYTCGGSSTENGMTGQEWLCANFDSFPVCSGDNHGLYEFCCPEVSSC